MSTAVAIANTCEASLFLAGLLALWHIVIRPAYARTPREPSPLAAWDVPGSSFLLSLWAVFVGYLVPGIGALQAVKYLPKHDESTDLIIVGAAAQFGMFAGWWLGRRLIRGMRVPLAPAGRPASIVFRDGFLVFLVAMPLVMGAALLWQNFLKAVGIPVVEQELVDIFQNADSTWFVALLLALAIVVAPVAEELVFRAGIFRFARSRLPRILALLLPNVLFGLVHLNWATFVPLVLLGVIFSEAFERTGDIRVTMIAHALFNLNSSLLVLLGVDPTG